MGKREGEKGDSFEGSPTLEDHVNGRSAVRGARWPEVQRLEEVVKVQLIAERRVMRERQSRRRARRGGKSGERGGGRSGAQARESGGGERGCRARETRAKRGFLGSLVEAAGEEAEKRKERTGRRSAGVGEEGEGKARRRLSAAANLQVRRCPLSLFSSFPI